MTQVAGNSIIMKKETVSLSTHRRRDKQMTDISDPYPAPASHELPTEFN